ncbi:GGDEF domain-containing protein [Amphritea pacifica]|uniref:diguanylate cyclase n=1 Tax=Amphritea pacifica TaxID=2811233 RepID=A0ABS2WBA5_9GAMM|nr:GGDEF domain-containing protein [Amphritea pacifica]MBN0988881.1 GGDEF domain-containing protein [Amphritea pacifica]MBN1006907.1 GGDEF domain-containing protein [Amphritea pacifica]
MEGDLENFLHILDCLPVAAMVLMFNEDSLREPGRQSIVYVNQKYQQLIGLPLDLMPSQDDGMVVAPSETQPQEKMLLFCRSIVQQLREAHGSVQERLQVRCSDGNERDFQVTGDNCTVIQDHYLITFQEVTRFTAEIEQLKQQSEIDQLTGVFNQHHLLRRLAAEVERAQSSGTGFTLMMFDLDFFKDVNDHYGHNCGDQVLITTVDIIRTALSGVDCLARWNGADFVVLMREDNPGIARQVIQKAWQGVRAHTFCWQDSTFAMTTTVGLTTYRRGDTPESILDRADLALKRGKRVGGDFIFVDDSG